MSRDKQKSYKPYPKYKDSGIEWLGEIPKDWEVKKLKHICDSFADYGLNIKAEEYQSEGIRFIRTSDTDDLGRLKIKGVYLKKEKVDKFYNLDDGDILISRSGTIGRSFLYNASNYEPATYAGYLVRFSLIKSIIYPKYIFYFLLSNSFKEWLKTQLIESTISNVNGRKYANLPILFFNKINQKRIADFLDQKTSKIDQLIRSNKRLINLLKEKRQVIITQAVTKGLNPDVKMKDSGVEWLGKIPKHWKVMKLKFTADNTFSNVDKKTNEQEIPVRLCNYIDVYKNDYITNSIQFMDATASSEEIEKYKIKIGDVLVTKDSETPDDIATPALVKEISENLVCGYHLALLRPKKNMILGEYLFWLFVSKSFNQHFEVSARGITRYGLSISAFNDVKIPLLSIEEQIKVSTVIEIMSNKISSLVSKLIQQNKKLEEYRQALISNTVTGRIKVS